MIDSELNDLRRRSLEVNNDLIFKYACKISVDEMQKACRCMNAVSIAIDTGDLSSVAWSLNRETLLSNRASLPTLSNQSLAKMIGDLIDDVVGYVDANQSTVKIKL